MSAFADYSAHERMAQMLSHNLDLVREAAGVDEETEFDELLEVLRSRRPAESTPPRLPPSLRSVDDARREADALREAGESLYSALRRFAYAWETDTPGQVMWSEWQRAKNAMTAYRSDVAATAREETP